MAAAAADTFRSLLEPFTLEDAYPSVMTGENGVVKYTKKILPHQMKIHNGISLNGSRAKFILMSGGVGCGKSLMMSAEVWRSVRTEPGVKWVVVLPYDYFFSEFLRPTWNKVVPDESPHIASKNVKEHSYIFTNGSEVRFHAYDEPDKVRGWEAHRIWIEEGAEMGQGNNDKAFAIWQALTMRLRAGSPPYPLRMYITQNPKGHNWIWRAFIRNEPLSPQLLGDDGQETIFGYTDKGEPKAYYEWEKISANGDVFYTVAMGSIANEYLPKGYIESSLGTMADSPATRMSMIEGRFNPIASLCYEAPIYSERTHVIDYQRFLEYWEIDEVPKWWKCGVGIDCGGSRSPWAVEYFIQCPSGEWVCFDEIYQKGLTWKEIAEQILDKGEGFQHIEYWIDPISSQMKDGPTAVTIEEEFRAYGLGVRSPKGYNKWGCLGRVHDLMNRDHTQPCPYMDDVVNADDDGKMVFEIGKANIYYLTNVPGKHSIKNPKGHACPANLLEKGVFRFDDSKQREPKASEEGLTPMKSMKIMDRDDHAQTAEFFLFLGQRPFVKRLEEDSHGSRKRSPIEHREEPVMYGGMKRRRMR